MASIAPPERVPAYSWYALAVLTTVYVLNFLDRTLIYILFTPIKKEMAFSDLQLALLGTTSFVIFYTLLGIPFGHLADRTAEELNVARICNAIGLAKPTVNDWLDVPARLGMIYREQQNYPLAVETFRKMLLLGDENARSGYQEIIDTYREAKQWPQATAVAKEAVLDALYGVMMVLEGIPRNDIDSEHWLRYVLSARVRGVSIVGERRAQDVI